jgi:hypothetical protein
MKAGFLEDSNGDKSNSRLMADIAIIAALCFSGIIIWIGNRSLNLDIIAIAGAAGLIFTTIAGPAMAFLFLQKKEEGKQDEVKQELEIKAKTAYWQRFVRELMSYSRKK